MPAANGPTGPSEPGVPVVRSVSELAAALPAGGPRAVVMTMGALHEGHLELVRVARQMAEQVVVTIFVNPLQFGPTEDFEAYPRDLDADVAALARLGVDVVFAPTAEEMYASDSGIRVEPGAGGTVLEGAIRPGHFAGVLTVVLKLLNLTSADLAVFGAKDAQQLALVRAMVHDLNLPVQIVSVPTVREPDGLARSSRNAYLNPEERRRAVALSRALAAGVQAAADGANVTAVQAAMSASMPADVAVDYLVVLDGAVPAEPGFCGPAVVAGAIRLGGTRLIDNMPVVIGGPDGACRCQVAFS